MREGFRNPYPGPRPFGPEEYNVFAGRDHEISELSSLIVAHPAVLLYAESGTGKTSLLNAGIAPTLRKKGIELLPICRVGIPPPKNASSESIQNVYAFSTIGDLLPDLSGNDTWALTATLSDALSRVPKVLDKEGEPAIRVLAFDQFEELFVTSPDRWADKQAFFHQIADVVAEERSVRVLFVLRQDYLGAFVDLANILPEAVRTRYRLQRLRADEALRAITCPLEGSRWFFAEDVAETLVNDLLKITVETAVGQTVTVPGEFVEPVQLQVVCFTLLEHLPSERKEITLQDLRTFGNPEAALRSFYESVLKRALVRGGSQGRLRSWFDTHLITSAGTRGLVFQSLEGADGIPSTVITILENQHIIRPEIRSGSRWLELTHDTFIGPIRESNAAWRRRRSRLRLTVAVTTITCLVAMIGWREIRQIRSIADATAANRRQVEELKREAEHSRQGAELVQRAAPLVSDDKQTPTRRAEALANLALAQCVFGDTASADKLFKQARDTDALAALQAIGQPVDQTSDDTSKSALSVCRHTLLVSELHDPQVAKKQPLHDFICLNNYLVIVTSGMPGPAMNTQLETWRKRYPGAIITNQPQDNLHVGIAVASFAALDDAKKVLLEVKTKYGGAPYIGLESRQLQSSCK